VNLPATCIHQHLGEAGIGGGAQDSATPLAGPHESPDDSITIISAHARSRLIDHDQWWGPHQGARERDQALLARG
jgi:hypothetical protein